MNERLHKYTETVQPLTLKLLFLQTIYSDKATIAIINYQLKINELIFKKV